MWFAKLASGERYWEAKGSRLLGIGKQKLDSSGENPRVQERVPGNWESAGAGQHGGQ